MITEEYQRIKDYFRVGDIDVYKVMASHYDDIDMLWVNINTGEYKWVSTRLEYGGEWKRAYFLNINEADDVREDMAEKHPNGRRNIHHYLLKEIEASGNDTVITSTTQSL